MNCNSGERNVAAPGKGGNIYSFLPIPSSRSLGFVLWSDTCGGLMMMVFEGTILFIYFFWGGGI